MNTLSGLSLISTIVCLCLSIIVYSFNKKATLNRIFLATGVTAFIYGFSSVMMWDSSTLENALFWHKMGSIWPFFVVLTLHFALIFTKNSWLNNKRNYLLLYPPAFIFTLIELSTNLINEPPILQSWGYNDVASGSIVYILSTFWTVLLPILSFILCLKFYRQTDEIIKKEQSKFVAVGFGIPIFAFILTNIIGRSLGLDIPNLGFVSTSFFGIFVGYAIVKYNLFAFDAAVAAENIIQTIPDSLILADGTGKILKANQRFIDFLDYPSNEVVGQKLDKFCAPGKELCQEMLVEFSKKQFIRNKEVNLKTKSGEIIQALFSGSLVKSKIGRIIGMVFVIRDITERKKAEEELAETKNYLETILNTMLSGILIIDAKTHEIVDVNEAGLRIIGAERKDVVGRVCHKFVCPAQVGKCPITDLGLFIDNQERQLFRSDGVYIPILKNAVELQVKDRLLLIENFIDISEHKKMEEHLVKTERLASIGELAGQIGHDLRNPLAGIKNGIYFLRKKNSKSLPENSVKIFDAIEQAIEDSNRIISSLVDYAGDLYIEPKESTPKFLISQALSRVQVPEYIELQDYTNNEPKLYLDAAKIEKAFANIIQNAVQAISKKGIVQIKSGVRAGYLEIEFIDSGVGIPDTVLPRLFDPLVTTKAKGMGMGLAICRRIIELHQGTISIISTVGKGTTVRVKLPIRKTKEEINTLQKADSNSDILFTVNDALKEINKSVVAK